MPQPVVRAGLREVAATRAALDSLEAALVVRARAAGATWTELGELLGLTKQGARSRHLRIDPIYDAWRRRRQPQTIDDWHAELATMLEAQGRSEDGDAVDA